VLDYNCRKTLGLRPAITNHKGVVVSKRAKIMVWTSKEDGRPWFGVEALAKLFNRSVARTRDAVRRASMEAASGMTRKVKSTGAPKVAVDARLVGQLFHGCRPRIAAQVEPWFQEALEKFAKKYVNRYQQNLAKKDQNAHLVSKRNPHPFAKAVEEFDPEPTPIEVTVTAGPGAEISDTRVSSPVEVALTNIIKKVVDAETYRLRQQVDGLQHELEKLKETLRQPLLS
jgi:hypothetical protein